MKNAILLHGKPGKEEYYDPTIPSASNAHWFPWLQKQLLTKDIKADTPEVPFAFDPQWERWVREVERFEVGPETILVGHSCGGGFWLRYLSERPQLRVGRVVLVAPWLDPTKESAPMFFDFVMDRGLVSRTRGLSIFNSDDDQDSVQLTIQKVRAELSGFDYKEFHGYGHFTQTDMGGKTDFPELLEECLR